MPGRRPIAGQSCEAKPEGRGGFGRRQAGEVMEVYIFRQLGTYLAEFYQRLAHDEHLHRRVKVACDDEIRPRAEASAQAGGLRSTLENPSCAKTPRPSVQASTF